MMPIAARLHLWPWSCASGDETVDLSTGTAHFDFYGSPVISLIEGSHIFLSSRQERFIALGPPFRSIIDGLICQLYQTPQGVISNGKKGGKLHVHHDATRSFLNLEPEGALPRFEGSDAGGKPLDSELATTILYWAQYFDELLEKAKKGNAQSVHLDWTKVLAHLLALRDQETGKPRRALIVDIAERMNRRLSQTVLAARRILIRERRLLPAGRLEETDSSCLRWLIRQPGNSVPEKAGPRQHLLGIARKETFDVHENRILKDFLLRCREEGRRYVRRSFVENPAYRATSRVQMVQTYSNLCVQLSRVAHLDQVELPIPGTAPNYVLLHDMRYKNVWQWYKKLLRRAEEEDRLWDWQARTWTDIARVLVSLALVNHVRELSEGGKIGLKDICQASLRLHGEQLLGCRAASGSEPGPLHVIFRDNDELRAQGVLEVVHPDLAEQHSIVSHLGAMGGHLYLVIRPLGHHHPAEVIVLWAVHTAAANDPPDWMHVGESAEAAIKSYQTVLNLGRFADKPRVRGLVLASDLQAKTASCEVEKKNLMLLTVPTEPRLWMTAVEDITLALDELLQEIFAWA